MMPSFKNFKVEGVFKQTKIYDNLKIRNVFIKRPQNIILFILELIRTRKVIQTPDR